jgi:signal peptide peptidase SppA
MSQSLKYPRIAARLYEEPWAIMPAQYAQICQAFEAARLTPERMAAEDPVGPARTDAEGRLTGQYAHPQIEVIDGVALATVHGTLGRGLSALDMSCGGYDTGLLREQLANIAEDATIHTLVVDFDSPGGMVAGTAAAAAAIRAVSAAGKRVIAYASGSCASAAYWLASACDEIHADPDAIVGSISTITSGVDSSRSWEAAGMELKLFATGKFKATGMAGKAWTAEEEENIWQRIRQLDAEFKGFIAERRALSADLMEGQWWYARHAPAGLIDGQADSLQSLLENILTA